MRAGQPAILFALVLVLTGLPAFASELGPVFRTLSVNEGLPDRRAEAIVQDEHGFIWIGTRGGLVRHEGERMRFIPSDPQTPNPLPGRNIMSLMAHSDGTVWAAVENRGVVQIGPDLGLRAHLDAEKQGGRLPSGNIWSMAEDCRGRVWMAFMRGGVAVFDPADNALATYPQAETAGLHPDGFQVHLEVDSACRVWLVQTSQVSVHEPRADRFRAVHRPGEAGISFHLAEALGRIYFNEGGVLYSLGPTAEASSAEASRVAEVDGLVTAIVGDPDSEQIIVGSTKGLHRLTPGTDRIRSVRHVPGLADGLPSNAVDSVMLDREGGLWLTTTRSGAAYLPPGWAAFERYHPYVGPEGEASLSVDPVISLAWDARSAGFWVGGLRGELAFLPDDQADAPTPRLSRSARETLAGSAVLDVLREGDTLYVATQTKIVRIDLGADGTHDVLMRREELDAGTFAQLRRKDADHLWIGTRDVGLFEYDERSGRKVRFHQGGAGRTFLPETASTDLMRGPEGNWWLLAPGGLYRWHEREGFRKQQLPLDRPPAAAAWQDRDLWLATDETLQHWRHRRGGFEMLREVSLRDGVPPGHILDILLDETGRPWLLRTSGLSVYRPGEDALRHLSRQDGLAAVEFGEHTATPLPNGRLAFAGRGGIVTVDPGRISRAAPPPSVFISRLQAGDFTVELDPLDDRSVSVEHDRNSLSIDFLATTYLAQDRTRYRVRLEGWDSDWIELVGQTRHHYSSLPPGRYRFRVQAAAPEGAWSRDGDVLSILVHRPPWLSGWALGAYALLAVTGAGAGVRGYRRANQRRREMREARHKRALAEEQRKIISRLNRSLEPMALAETIAREIVHVTGGRLAWLGYLDEQLPKELACSDPDRTMTREAWRRRIEAAEDAEDLVLTLRVAGRDIARVLVEAPMDGFMEEGRERLGLLEEMAGQTLQNALLLQRVRSLAERAEQASNAKSEFLATMSHEIRTPLHGVLGMVELLHETQTEPGQQDLLDTLRQSGLQLQRIIDDVLDISRIEAGPLSLSAQPFDLAAMLEQVVDLHAPNAARRGLDLRLRVAADLPLLANGDSDRISQVLGNLLNNAVKFTERGGIELSASVGRDGQLVVVVSDSGPGIGDADRERLFEPFTQLDASITRSHSGSGLGLAICRRLVGAMEGQLDLIDSCHGGSRFRVRLPVLEAPDERLFGRLSGLLDGQVIAASVTSPTLRILKALARRWGMRVVDARTPPERCDLLLIDPHTLDESESERLDRWRDHASATAWLQSPFPSRSAAPAMLPDGAHFLRWPLVESRLIGLLFDLTIRGS